MATSASSPGASEQAFLAFFVCPERRAVGISTTGYPRDGPAVAGEVRESASGSRWSSETSTVSENARLLPFFGGEMGSFLTRTEAFLTGRGRFDARRYCW